MIQLTPHMWIMVAASPVDFRKGIDGLAAVCKQELKSDPFCGTVFVFVCPSGGRVQRKKNGAPVLTAWPQVKRRPHAAVGGIADCNQGGYAAAAASIQEFGAGQRMPRTEVRVFYAGL